MTPVAIGFITFIIGAIMGYVGRRFLTSSTNKEQDLETKINQSEQALSQYKQDVAEHLEQSADLLTQMNKTCQKAMQQMEESTQLLKKATPIEPTAMPFFSAETHQQLAETATKRHPKRQEDETANISPAALVQPPLDYSDGPSGLFIDQKQSVTNSDT
ncbi:MAG: YhcB family protein [Alteromonadaceae bacterium]|nr:YhcB family protein [Alteromonadaceae bacterium]